MATVSKFHTVGRLFERDGEFKFNRFSNGQDYYTKETGKGVILISKEEKLVGYFRTVQKESKVFAYITWCEGDLTFQAFRDDEKPGEYSVTFAYEYETDDSRPQRETPSEGRKDRW